MCKVKNGFGKQKKYFTIGHLYAVLWFNCQFLLEIANYEIIANKYPIVKILINADNSRMRNDLIIKPPNIEQKKNIYRTIHEQNLKSRKLFQNL